MGSGGTVFRFFGPGIGALLIYNMHGWIHSRSEPRSEAAVGIGRIHRYGPVPGGWIGLGTGGCGGRMDALLLGPDRARFLLCRGADQLGAGAVVGAVWRFVLAAMLASAAALAATNSFPFFADGEQTWVAATVPQWRSRAVLRPVPCRSGVITRGNPAG